MTGDLGTSSRGGARVVPGMQLGEFVIAGPLRRTVVAEAFRATGPGCPPAGYRPSRAFFASAVGSGSCDAVMCSSPPAAVFSAFAAVHFTSSAGRSSAA